MVAEFLVEQPFSTANHHLVTNRAAQRENTHPPLHSRLAFAHFLFPFLDLS
jgi:hypothetical protein